jgi:hypothetical protein
MKGEKRLQERGRRKKWKIWRRGVFKVEERKAGKDEWEGGEGKEGTILQKVKNFSFSPFILYIECQCLEWY